MKPTVFIEVILLSLFIIAPEISASCVKPIPEKFVSEHDHIFVGFVTDAYFSEEDDLECGVAIGNIELVEKLKGDPSLVEVVKQHLWTCKGYSIAGKSDNFPVGHFVVVFSNGEAPFLSGCGPTQKIEYIEGETCLVDRYRRILNLDHADSEHCLELEEKWKADREKYEAERVRDDA
jgi:hypothetical protein